MSDTKIVRPIVSEFVTKRGFATYIVRSPNWKFEYIRTPTVSPDGECTVKDGIKAFTKILDDKLTAIEAGKAKKEFVMTAYVDNDLFHKRMVVESTGVAF
jgi:hypothetical protein